MLYNRDNNPNTVNNQYVTGQGLTGGPILPEGAEATQMIDTTGRSGFGTFQGNMDFIPADIGNKSNSNFGRDSMPEEEESNVADGHSVLTNVSKKKSNN